MTLREQAIPDADRAPFPEDAPTAPSCACSAGPGWLGARPLAWSSDPGPGPVLRQPDRVRERAARHAAIHLGREQLQHEHPGILRPVQRQYRELHQLQDRVAGENYNIDIYRMGYYGGD